MTNGMEILLVEDSPEDVEITLRAFQKYHLANKIHVVRDGEEALECLFSTGRYAEQAGLLGSPVDSARPQTPKGRRH